MIRAIVSGLIGFTLVLPLIGGASAQDIEAGKAIAQKNCARCHAIGMTGASPNKNAPPFREIVKRYPVENLEEAFGEGIIVGHKEMPEFSFPPEKIGDLLGYLGSLSQ